VDAERRHGTASIPSCEPRVLSVGAAAVLISFAETARAMVMMVSDADVVLKVPRRETK
jgi:hypothetical protein